MKSEDNCLDYNGYDLYLRECDGLKQNQRWAYKVWLCRVGREGGRYSQNWPEGWRWVVKNSFGGDESGKM